MSDDFQNQVLALQNENAKLSRQLSRLQATIERNNAAAASAASITAMQVAEKRKQEYYLRTILENSPNVILLLDNHCNIAYCTHKALIVAGLDYFVAVHGKHYREILKLLAEPDWIENAEQQINDALSGGYPLTLEAAFNVRGIEPRRYHVEFVPKTGTETGIGGSMITMHDITEIRKMHEEAEEARHRAEQASLAKSSFLSNMSHEIRTPMNAIIGMTAIGRAADDAEKKEYCLSKIDEASKHLLGVINDILDMSKIEANKFELSYTNVNFERMIRKVTTFITFRVDERYQKFDVHIDQRIPAVIETDEQRLAQVITNLLSNAVKFTPEEGKITLATELVDENSEECMLKFGVTDTGIGISQEQQHRLFHSFEQADSSTARKFGGTGLGLAISKRIVEMMGGRIWIESEIGKGATFFFEIKAKRRSRENARDLRSDLTLTNLRLLIVDDSVEMLEYFVHIMEKLKIRCDVANSGIKACELIHQKGPYDIYFIDWHMPEMTGIELTQKIKRQSGSDLSVCVMMSAQDWHHIELEARAAGIDSFLQKPISSSTVVDCLNRYVDVTGGVDKKHVMLETIFEGKCILLAEDVKINREIVKAQLATTKIEIDMAENGKKAVEMFSENPRKYDMIFMDVQMPEMDGLEATRIIRTLKIPEAKTIPIVAMTANVFREDIEQCLAAGMNDHVGKPLDIMIVVEIIKRYAKSEGTKMTDGS